MIISHNGFEQLFFFKDGFKVFFIRFLSGKLFIIS